MKPGTERWRQNHKRLLERKKNRNKYRTYFYDLLPEEEKERMRNSHRLGLYARARIPKLLRQQFPRLYMKLLEEGKAEIIRERAKKKVLNDTKYIRNEQQNKKNIFEELERRPERKSTTDLDNFEKQIKEIQKKDL